MKPKIRVSAACNADRKRVGSTMVEDASDGIGTCRVLRNKFRAPQSAPARRPDRLDGVLHIEDGTLEERCGGWWQVVREKVFGKGEYE